MNIAQMSEHLNSGGFNVRGLYEKTTGDTRYRFSMAGKVMYSEAYITWLEQSFVDAAHYVTQKHKMRGNYKWK